MISIAHMDPYDLARQIQYLNQDLQSAHFELDLLKDKLETAEKRIKFLEALAPSQS